MLWNKHGILGINARNLKYIRPYNQKKVIKLADDKIKTKQFLSARDIPVPRLYNILRNPSDVEKFDYNILPNKFVVKPNQGYGGEGIIPIIGKSNSDYKTAGGKIITTRELKDHCADIVDGRFSISNVADYAFFEQLIETDEVIGKFSYSGLPDIRIIVHNLIPVMAMLRLPTKESGGKANLHMGACGVGIDIAKGECTHITYKNKIITELPEGLGAIKGVKLPYWDDMLLIASKVQLLTNLGYMAIDLCIDKNAGPVLLEINARAGLAVQIANLAPLQKRLERIQGVKVTSPEKGIRIAKDMFGNAAERKIQNISGKKVIGKEEVIDVIQKNGTKPEIAKIDTSVHASSIDRTLAENLGLFDSESYDKDKETLKLKISIHNTRITTVALLKDLSKEEFKIRIGARDLTGFLVDPTKSAILKLKTSLPKAEKTAKDEKDEKTARIIQNNFRFNQLLAELDKQTKLLYHLKPLNIQSEREKFRNNHNYNPQFEYRKLELDPLEIEEKLEKIKPDNSPIGKLLKKKKAEISLKVQLLEAIDQANFTEVSKKLYGYPTSAEVKDALQQLKRIEYPEEVEELTVDEAIAEFRRVLDQYGLEHWNIKIKEDLVAGCLAGKNSSLFVRPSRGFSKASVKDLVVHEIETHILTAENGKNQFYSLFNRGFANYLETQEGLAVYNVEQQCGQSFLTKASGLCHVVAINFAMEHSLSETYQHLIEVGFKPPNAIHSVFKIKRGFADTSQPGAFTKDALYFKGYKKVQKFIKSGGKIKDLYYGKYDLDDLHLIKQIPELRNPKLLPNWLD